MPRSHQRRLVVLTFAVLLLVGLLVHRRYGYSWDEETSRCLNGRPNFIYLTTGERRAVKDTPEKYHGPVFEIVLYALEVGLRLDDTRSVYFMRHLVTFLLFFASVVVFYRVLRRRFHSRWIGLLGAGFLVLSPRIFADAFYNSKDLALLSAYVFSLATLGRFLDKPSLLNTALHSLACAFLIDIRIVGVVVPCLTLPIAAGAVLAKRWRGEKVPWHARALLGFVLLTAAFVILFWPILWHQPHRHFQDAFQEMSRYPFPMPILYRGELLKASELPWHYLPWWMLITTPLFYTFLFVLGVVVFFVQVGKAPIRLLAQRPADVAWAAAFFGPVAAVVVLHSTVYDGWRHLYFVYPAFLFLAVLGFRALLTLARLLQQRTRLAVPVFLTGCAVPLMQVGWLMVRDHPYQNVYFNRLAGRDLETIKSQYELDYWGLSCREGLEKLLAADSRPVVVICAQTPAVSGSILLLSPQQRARLRTTPDPARADYFVSHYRCNNPLPRDRDFCTVRVGGAALFVALTVH